MNRTDEIHLLDRNAHTVLEQLRGSDNVVLGIDGGGLDDLFGFYVLGTVPKCVFLSMTTTRGE